MKKTTHDRSNSCTLLKIYENYQELFKYNQHTHIINIDGDNYKHEY